MHFCFKACNKNGLKTHYKSPQSHFLHIVRHFGSFQSIWLLKIKSLASLQMVSVDFAAKSNSAAKSTKALLHTLMAETGLIKIQAFCFPITKLIIFFNEGAVEKNILNYYIACKRWLLAGGRSYKSIAVPPPQVFGLVGPPKKRVNRDKLNHLQKVRTLCFGT